MWGNNPATNHPRVVSSGQGAKGKKQHSASRTTSMVV